MYLAIKLSKGIINAELLEKRKYSCLVRLPDGHIIVRKNNQIVSAPFEPVILPKQEAKKLTFWQKIWQKILKIIRGKY